MKYKTQEQPNEETNKVRYEHRTSMLSACGIRARHIPAELQCSEFLLGFHYND